jgi:hypothetical protein
MRNTRLASFAAAAMVVVLSVIGLGVPAESRAGALGAPLEGVDMKLGKNPGGILAGMATTDGAGNFDFGVLPKGSYSLTLTLRGNAKHGSVLRAVELGAQPEMAPAVCLVALYGAQGGAIMAGWDFQKAGRVEPETAFAAKTIGDGTIVLISDGKRPLFGTVVKAKSNITNN